MPYSRLFYHFIWATKDRQLLITDLNRHVLFAAISSKIGELDGRLHALNAMPNHVHLVASVPPNLSLASFIGPIKGSSSRAASRLDGSDNFAWQNEYGVLSVSESHLPIVIRYVQNQQQHHADNKLNLNLENTG